jgi:hypothetical protein
VLNKQFNSLKKYNFLILKFSIINSEVQYRRNFFRWDLLWGKHAHHQTPADNWTSTKKNSSLIHFEWLKVEYERHHKYYKTSLCSKSKLRSNEKIARRIKRCLELFQVIKCVFFS